MYSIDVLGKDFSTVVKLFKILKENMTFIDIKNGRIAQYDDSRRVVYDINLVDILGELTFNFHDMKRKIKLFETFRDDVKIEVDDKSLIIKDGYSKLTINKTDSSYCQTPYIESIDNIYDIFYKNCILKTSIPKIISDRIRVALQIFDIDSLKLKSKDGKASIMVDSLSKDQNMVFIDNIDMVENIDFEMFFPSDAFMIENEEDVSFSVHAEKKGQFLFNYNVLFDGIDINIFGLTYENN